MWSSKDSMQSRSARHSDAESIRRTGASSSDSHPVLVMNDGSLELESNHFPQATRFASSTLQFVERSKHSDMVQNVKADGNKPYSVVYINHQGHTVKMARLADPPPRVSFPVKGTRLHDDSRSFVRKSLGKNMIPLKKMNGSKQCESTLLVELEKHKEDSVGLNLPSKSVEEGSVPPCKKHPEPLAVGGNIMKKSGSSTLAFSSTSRSKTVPKATEDDHVCRNNQTMTWNQSGTKDIHCHSTLRQPSVIKEELENGLKKITADLVALRVMDRTDMLADDGFEKGDHKRPLPVEPVTEDSEDSKENNSPRKRSKGSQMDQSKGGNIEKLQSSRPSLSGSRGSLRLSQSYEPSLQTSFCSINVSNQRKSSLADAKPSPSREKTKSYDPEKAREFIRRQKKERLCRLKAEREQKKAEMDARREKLNELSRTSLKLVKASIKSKPYISNGTFSEKAQEDDRNEPVHVQSDLNDNHTAKTNGWRIPPSSNQSVSESVKCSSDIQSTVLDVSACPDLSNSQLIREISDMKSKIEAMSKTLKSTFVNSRGRRPPGAPKSEKTSMSASSVGVALEVNSKADSGLKTKLSSELKPTYAGQIVMEDDDISVQHVMQSNISPAYLHGLTSNLRKMRESLLDVLGQSELPSSGGSVDHELITNPNRALSKHRRFSSAGSESACGILFSNHSPSSDGHFSSKNLTKKITTSFPTLPLADTNHIPPGNAHHRKATSVADISDIDDLSRMADIKSGQMDPNFGEQTTSSKDSILDKSFIKKGEKDHPPWLDKFGKPYPINIMSAVKHKLGRTARDDIPSDRNALNSSRTVITQISDLRNNDPKLNPSLLPRDERTGFPSTVTERHGQCPTKGLTTIDTLAPNLIPPSFALDPPGRRETFSSTYLLRNHEKQERSNFRPISPAPCSILEALNLEKMNNDFENALNFSSNKPDIMPAEKPLSAPNTPAKDAGKLNQSRAEQFCSGSSQILSKPTEIEGFDRPAPLESSTSSGDKHLKDNKLPSAVSKETTCLIPPNINLLSGRMDQDLDRVENWVSHSQNSEEKTIPNDKQEGNISQSSHHKSSSIMDTFEIGHVFNPTALHLQFQAELNILDSFNESLCQVMEIEKVRAVALARHQALLENQAVAAPMEDKSIDVQKSLLKSNSEISSINYTRGSGALSPVTSLNNGTSSLGMINSDQILDDTQNLPLKEDCGSSTAASETLSSTIEKPALTVGQSHTDEANKQEPPSTSTEKSISEEIQSASVDFSETTDGSVEKNNDDEEVKHTVPNATIQKGTVESNSSVEANNLKKSQEALALDVSVNTYNADSSSAGNEALLIESLSRSECHIFPSLTSGDDMFEFTLQMLEQLMHEEELRVQHKNTLLKLRVKVLGEMARAEVASLDLDKKKLREKGEEGHKDQISALRKKQRGIMLRFQQQREDIERMRRTEELAWQERRLMYLQQMHLIRMQVSTRVMLRKFEKTGGSLPKKSRVVFRSIRENRTSKSAQRGLSAETNTTPHEGTAVGLSLTHSSSVSLASLVSDASRSSVLSNSSRRPGGAGDSESSHLEDRVLKGLNELENRCRDLKDREKALHEKRQSVEQIIQWRRKLEEEEHHLKDVEKQAHGRQRSSFTKHALRDRSTSPFQFPDSGASVITVNGNGVSSGRSVSDIVRSGRNSGSMGGNGSHSVSASITEEVDSSIPEEISENTSKPSADSTPNATNTDQYANESFESEVSEVKPLDFKSNPAETQHAVVQKEQNLPHTSKSESDCDTRLPRMSERSNKYPGVTIKVPLSPRLQRVQRRRYSSGSDDSMVLSQTETGSEQSDIEGRISALTEQLQQCKAEAERLRREAKRTRNERLIAKEQSLQKQLQAYETYICQLRTNLDAELKQSSVPIVRPQIKQPRVASGKVASRRQDVSPTTASVSQATSPDANNVRKDDSEFEAVAIASEAASEATSEAASEAASEVPSDVASEVSENSSLISNEAPSLVANKAAAKELPSFSNEEGRTAEVLSDASETGSESLSAIITEVPEETSSGRSAFKEIDETNRKPKLETGSEEHIFCDLQASYLKDETIHSTEPAKSLSSEGEPDDISELLEDDHEAMEESEDGSSSEVIKVFLREKERDGSDHSSNIVQEKPEVVPEVSCVVSSREELVDRITNQILEGLMKECLQPATRTHSFTLAQKHSSSTEAVLDSFIKESLNEATDDILSIYKRKRVASPSKSEENTGGNRSQDVRKRVNEILAETQSPSVLRAKGRVREMMVTTYGVLSPDDSPCGSPNQANSPIQQLRPSSPVEHIESSLNKIIEANALSSEVATANKANNSQIGLVGVSVIDSEGISQEWFDEDFGLTHSRREAEELRRQQLQIELEIEQLQQQQAQVQEQIPYYYVREIPNKPPPPYTPPGQAPRVLSSSSSLSPPVEEIRAVCSDRQTILKCISSAVDFLFDLRQEGNDITDCEPPDSYVDAGFGLAVPSHLTEKELAVHRNSARVYRMFLFDLAKQLIMSAYSCEQEDPNPPWLRPENWVRRRKALAVVPRTREMLHDFVSKEALVLFGFVPKASKENLTIRWSRKKRDHVDELLVRESQEEERQWTNYEQDEAVVKNNVTLAILDSLLDDTVRVLCDIYKKKMQKQCTESMNNECSVY